VSDVAIDRLSRDDAGTDCEHRGPLDGAPGRHADRTGRHGTFVGELPATCIKCLLDSPDPSDTVAKLLTSERWQLVTGGGDWRDTPLLNSCELPI
jgi:hypothetical protein